MVAHIPVILGEGDAGIDRGFARRDRHIGGVGDQNGAGGQRLARLGVDQLAELLEHLGHLVAALPAADIDDDIRIAPFGELVLGHRFAGAEPARHCGGAALGNREEGVDHPLAGNQRAFDRAALSHRARYPDRPFVGKAEFMPDALPVLDNDQRVKDPVCPVRNHRNDCPGQAGRTEGAVLDDCGFLAGGVDVPTLDLVALPDPDGGFPLFFNIEGRDVAALGDECARLFCNHVERAFDPVKDVGKDARAEGSAERPAGAGDRLARMQPGGNLIDLDGGPAGRDIDDLTDQALFPDVDHLHHLEAGRTLHGDDRAVNRIDNWLQTVHPALF